MRLVMWINAFIPGHVPGYTQVIMRGENQGLSAVPMPKVARLGFNAHKPIGTGFLTDQRDFSDKMGASVRMQSAVFMDVYPLALHREMHTSSGTRQVTIPTGETWGDAVADMSDCSASAPHLALTPDEYVVKPWHTHPVTRGGSNDVASWQPDMPVMRAGARADLILARKIQRGQSYAYWIKVTGAAGDPLVNFAANIDYSVRFFVDVDAANSRIWVAVEGVVDNFPAFECYAKYLGTTKTLFRRAPPKGNTVADLLGGPSNKVKGTADFALLGKPAQP